MKAFTEFRPKYVGAIAITCIVLAVGGILLFNRSLFASGYTLEALFPNAVGMAKGTDVLVAGVKVGSVTAIKVEGNHVVATLSVSHSVELPHHTDAAVEVETLIGIIDVTLKPVAGWSHPLQNGAFISNTSVPTEFYQLQNTAQKLLSKTNAKAL
ncbi:MAG TPA: MlaD family protein, partial [Acidimicrobiales bacterium]|nr:MlaD family protein [Acidimicrobiales bacterium]